MEIAQKIKNAFPIKWKGVLYFLESGSGHLNKASFFMKAGLNSDGKSLKKMGNQFPENGGFRIKSAVQFF